MGSMVDREKFKVYEMDEHRRASVQKATLEAEIREEKAARPKDGEVEMTNLAERMGRPIQVGTFISILKRLNPSLIFELSRADPSKYGVYRPIYGAAAISAGVDKVFICGMESGINLGGRIDEGVMPEFSFMENYDVVVPDLNRPVRKKFLREIRGWRTVLASLYTEGLLTELQIEWTFKVSEGRDSANWQKRTRPSIVTGV